MAQKSLAQVLALPPIQWRIAKLLPVRGMLIVGGAPKRGKSRVVLDVVRRLVQGRQALGALDVRPARRALIYNIEGGFEGVREREPMFESMKPEDQAKMFVEDTPILFTHATGSVRGDAIDEAATAWRGFDVVVLDPLVHFRACDENNNQHSAALMRAIRLAGEKAGTSLIIVHHARKGNPDEGDKGGGELRGASAIFAAADNVMMIHRTDDLLLECVFDLRYSAPGDLDELMLQSDLVSGLFYRRIQIGGMTMPDPRDFALDWGGSVERYAEAFGLAPEVAGRLMGAR